VGGLTRPAVPLFSHQHVGILGTKRETSPARSNAIINSTADAEFLVLGSKNQRYAFLLDRIGGRRVLRSTRYNSLQLQKGAAVTASTAVAPGTRIANLRRRAALRVHPPELVVPEVRESTCRPATGCACGPLVGRRQFGFEHRSPTRFATMSFVSLVNSSRAGISLES
jgi:hypothetical protein